MNNKSVLAGIRRNIADGDKRLNKHLRKSGWRWVSKNFTEYRHTIHFLIHVIYQNRKFALFNISLTVLGALLDGSTFAILAIAVDSLFQSGNLGAESSGQIGFVVDYLNGNFSTGAVFAILIGLIILTQLLYASCTFGSSVALAHLQANTETNLVDRLFKQFLSMSYASISQHKIGDLISYIAQVRQVGHFIQGMNRFVTALLTILVYTGLLVWLSWPMTLIAVVILGLLSFFIRKIIFKVKQLSKSELQASVHVNEHVNEYLQGLRLVRTFAQEKRVQAQVGVRLEESRTAKRQGLIWSGLVSPLFESVIVLAIALFLIAGYFAIDLFGAQPLGQTAVFLLILYRLMPRISTLNASLTRQMQNLPAVERVANMLRFDDKEYLATGTTAFYRLERDVQFENVSLSYGGDGQKAIQNLSMKIPAGKMVALVGESGAGKSSIMNLLLRLYQPTSGRITADGVDLSSINRVDWLSKIGIVDQDPFLLNASIRDNIAFGKADASEDEVIAAAITANADEFIKELEDGYNSIVGDRGYRLSGGQRQRIAIARAVLRKPEILLFDEATSDLDSHSEKMIQEALVNLRQQRTVIVIAHRLSTVTMADSIIVLHKGELLEQGTHEELLERDGTYANFWRIQSSAE